MPKWTLLIFGILLTGCAETQDRVPTAQAPTPLYLPASAAGLVFDPPIASYAPLPVFTREGRSPAAFYGYEQQGVDSYQLRQRDTLRGNGNLDHFDRTTYSGRSTLTYR